MQSYGEMFEAASACKTREEAAAFVQNQIRSLMEQDWTLIPEQARQTVLSNIGYMAGYCDRTEAARILELFDTRHPYFGAIEDWPKTPEEAIAIGFKVGSQEA